MTLLVTVLYILAAVLGAAFAFMEFRLLYRFVHHREEIRDQCRLGGDGAERAEDEDDFPTVTIQIPLYNERTAAERAIAAAAAQDYPRHRFDIQVLDDSTDETTEIVARLTDILRARGVRIEHLHRSNRDGFKAGALREGLKGSDAEFVAVFDADFSPPPDFLRRILVDADAFADPRTSFVQSRWAWDRSADDILWSGFGVLLDRHFFIQKPVREFLGNVATFNGSGGIWRRAAIEDAGGWSSDTLTEDLDLSYRCALKGWEGRYVKDVAVENDLPGDMRAFKIQQLRWSRGNAQCFRKLSGKVLSARSMLKDRLEEIFLLAGYAIHPILVANLFLWPWAVLYVNRSLFLGLQVFMSLATIAAPLSLAATVRERDGRLRRTHILEVLGGLCLGIGLMVNNTAGQIMGALGREGEFARTPKVPRPTEFEETRRLGSQRPYRVPLHWTFFAELLVLLYALAGAAVLIRAGDPLWSFPLFFWAGCIGLVVWLQLRGRERRPEFVPVPVHEW
ncbi:MAG: glycosyltransferase family 2 protein [Gemmatimonadota bacterium]